MEDKHILVDDGWKVGTGPWADKIVPGSGSWPHCAFYACFDGHGGARAAALASTFLWKRLQTQLVSHLRRREAAAGSSGGSFDVSTAGAAEMNASPINGLFEGGLGGLLGSLGVSGDSVAGAADVSPEVWLEEAIRRAFASCEVCQAGILSTLHRIPTLTQSTHSTLTLIALFGRMK